MGFIKAFALIKPVADQLSALVIERARVATGIIPDRPTGVWKVLLLTRRKRTANRVVLVAGNRAHIPPSKIDRAEADILERDHLRYLIDVHDPNWVIWRGLWMWIRLAVIV